MSAKSDTRTIENNSRRLELWTLAIENMQLLSGM